MKISRILSVRYKRLLETQAPSSRTNTQLSFTAWAPAEVRQSRQEVCERNWALWLWRESRRNTQQHPCVESLSHTTDLSWVAHSPPYSISLQEWNNPTFQMLCQTALQSSCPVEVQIDSGVLVTELCGYGKLGHWPHILDQNPFIMGVLLAPPSWLPVTGLTKLGLSRRFWAESGHTKLNNSGTEALFPSHTPVVQSPTFK